MDNTRKPTDVFIIFICAILAITLLLALVVCTGVVSIENDAVRSSANIGLSDNGGGSDGFIPMGDAECVRIDAVTGFTVDSKTGISDFSISNLESNGYPCSIMVSLGDGTLLFESPVLNPGDKVDGIRVSKRLERGIYRNACIVYIFYSDIGNRNVISTCQFPVDINVK